MVSHNSLFLENLHLVSSEKELDTRKGENPDLDPYYVTSACLEDRRQIFESLWEEYQEHADPHFLCELKSNFHERTWEMYLGNVLMGKNFNLSEDSQKNRKMVKDQILS